QADVLHLNLGNAVGYKAALLAARFSRAKRQMATVHLAGSYPQPESIKQLVSKNALKFFYSSIDRIITVSEANRKQLTNYFELPDHKIQVIYNGVSVEKYLMSESVEKSRILLKLPVEKKLVVIVGRLHEQKGHIYLIRAARKIIDAIPDCHFIIVGDGALRESLQKLINELNLTTSFTFLGFRTDIPRILNAIDLFILPSHDEGLPLVLLEAMAAGKPVIATAVGGVAELVQNKRTGILIPPGEVDAIVLSVVDLLKSDEQMRWLGNQAREYVLDNFSHEKMLKKTYENYE
ncbi:glycosyltransferase family 4 protein, partial [candidate division KSB1 bacterium]|nr:glycosyltransferase family 4 protein [candidate division KSB1 bacterium]